MSGSVSATTVAYMSIAASIAAAGMSAYGQMQQSQAQKAQAEYQSAVARNNQIIGEQNAADAMKRGEIEADKHRAKVQQLKGTQKAAMAAGGFEIDTGSNLDILADTAQMGELDALTILNNAEREAYQHKVAAMNSSAQAGLYGMAAASQSPLLSGGTALVGGLATAAGNYARYNNDTTPKKA
jgi:hypothetical protein